MRRLVLVSALIFALAGASPAVAKTRLFRSPSGNVACLYSSSGGPGPYVRCDVLSLGDWAFYLYTKHKASRHHATDSVNDPAHSKRLRYGKKRRFGRYTCKSYRSGMKCVNRRNHHGFKLSRGKQKLF